MRTNSSSSFGSSIQFEDTVSACSSTTSPELNEAYGKLKIYGKYFTTRLFQILVQSRTNENHDHTCLGKTAVSDWFNVRVDELGEVSAQIKRSIQVFPPEIPCVTIDFFLYTVDQETLPLESWSFTVGSTETSQIGTPTKPDMSELYHNLATMLKSAQLACHMTPMHRYYVKKQGPETFVILYRILCGTSSIELGLDAKVKTIGCFPTAVGPFKLTLSYRTKFEIERTMAASTATPPTEIAAENTDSFQQVGSFSSGNTPDYGNIASSPMSIGGISHFSVSPPSAYSPATDPGPQRQARSRTCSLASDAGSDVAPAIPKERMMTSHSLPSIPKNMPFANLLTLSYTGTLHSVPEERERLIDLPKLEVNEEDPDDADSENAELDETVRDEDDEGEQPKETSPEGEETGLAPQKLHQLSPDFEVSQRTVVNYSMSDTMKPDSTTATEKLDSDDDDSFVKVPIFASNEYNDHGLSDFISSCKMPPKIESFASEDMTNMLSQIEEFSSNQGSFDQFISTIRNLVENDGDE